MKNSLKKLGLTKTEILNAPYIEQNHFGDYLKKYIETSEDEKYRIWQSNEDNVNQGQSLIIIEYLGIKNNYTWKTIKTY
jgi:hypothetical protein